MKRLICMIFALIFVLGCAGCSAREYSKSVFAMDTVMELKVWGADGETAISRLEDMLRGLEDRWSATRQDSVTALLNQGTVPSLTAEEEALLRQVEALSQRTQGAFDPKLGSVSRLWGFYDKQYRVPTAQQIQAALQQETWDLGAAMKGYAGQQAAKLLQELDVQCALLNLGGNIQTFGTKPDGQPWRVGIQNPFGGDYVGIVTLEGTASVVTSGSYQRYFEQEGKRYHHIMDGVTGYPADSGLVSVTVICRDGLTADALSTALFVMGLEEGTRFWRQSSDFEAVFILTDGSIYATEGANLSGCEFKEITRENENLGHFDQRFAAGMPGAEPVAVFG